MLTSIVNKWKVKKAQQHLAVAVTVSRQANYSCLVVAPQVYIKCAAFSVLFVEHVDEAIHIKEQHQ